jgi:hypothetical protein
VLESNNPITNPNSIYSNSYTWQVVSEVIGSETAWDNHAMNVAISSAWFRGKGTACWLCEALLPSLDYRIPCLPSQRTRLEAFVRPGTLSNYIRQLTEQNGRDE